MNAQDYYAMAEAAAEYCRRVGFQNQEAERSVLTEIEYIWFYLEHNGFTTEAFRRIAATSRIRSSEDLEAIFLNLELIQ
jgi:hypothetical protein